MLYASHSWARKREFSTKGPKRGSGKLIVGMAILLVVAFKLDSLEPRWARNKKKRKKETKKRGEKNVRETRDAHRKEKEDERRVVVEDERTDSLIALPFRRGAPMHERARTCVYHAHPLLWMHTSRAVSTILKGSRRTFPARRNREQLTPRRLSIPFPPTLLPPFLSFHLFTLLLLPSPLPPFPRFTVETNAANTYISVCVCVYIYIHTQGHPW